MSEEASVGVWAYSTPRSRSEPFFGAASSASRRAAQITDFADSEPVAQPTFLNASGLALTLRDGAPCEVKPANARALRLKRWLDVSASLFALIVLFPAFLLLALLVKMTSQGPIIFRQTRAGLHGKPFVILKFRSIEARAHSDCQEAQSPECVGRVTPLGGFMRRNNLDELPQLFNVLKGEMSLVGPRPHTFDISAGGMPYAELVSYYHLRERMRPGLSGWAQINGYRGDTRDGIRARARIDHDLAYIENYSLLLDMRIIALTLIREVFGGTGS